MKATHSDKKNKVLVDKKVQQVILVEGSANVLVLIAKVIAGLSTGSMAILSDALHSLTDVANNFVVWGVVKHSTKPADREHPYGHRKFETLAVLGLAVLLILLAFELILHSFRREHTDIVSSPIEMMLMAGVLIINIGLASWQRMWANRLGSHLLQADASHTFADVLTTIIVIVGWQLASMGYLWLDQLCAIGVGLFILYLAYNLLKKVTPVLVDGYAIEPEALIEVAVAIDGVEAVSRVRSRWIGNDASIDMVILVKPELTTEQAHQICDQIELLVEREFAVSDISIHVEPNQ
ncbi:cation transporter [Aliikangiella marina]|uniref:Cation transporter n=1 Tax=Aliikangiella marina TaxID=1712262 RepID=A0A545T9W3_9GAMM|nr:cation diffusion facilitator family transporter [Aliikangiella marina]TQV73994.1 cation transporter [Aliikangiella marina]